MILKPSLYSGQGRGVICLKQVELHSLKDFLDSIHGDYIIQERVKQHPQIACLNNSSLNTFRVITLRRGSDVLVLSVVIKIGKNGEIVDNGHSGGYFVGVNSSGLLKKWVYSLSPYTPEEVISRNYILDEKPDCVINIVDATNLERNLYLTTQLLEIDVPMVLALNMMDLLSKNKESVLINKLEKELGIPVVEISALKEDNLDLLMQKAYEASNKGRKGKTVLEDTNLYHLINDCRIAFEGAKVENPLFHAVKLVELDELETEAHPNLVHIVENPTAVFRIICRNSMRPWGFNYFGLFY